MFGIKITCLISFCLLSGVSFSQTDKLDTVNRKSVIQYNTDDNRVIFSALTPPLQQMQGAPKAFYTYHWEFGDGQYSTDEKPIHTYKQDGEYTAQLWTTNNYDNGKPPPSRPQKIPIKKITYNEDVTPSLPNVMEGFQIKSNREPVPDEDMVVIVSYQNENDYPTNGKLYLFFNEKKFKDNNFSLLEVRAHNGEKEVQELDGLASCIIPYDPTTMVANNSSFLNMNFLQQPKNGPQLNLAAELKESKLFYTDLRVFEFDAMRAKETRNIFFSFKTTPQMLKDTSARITIKGIYVPERGVDKHKRKTLEMEIVTSHDPNKMSISDTRLNYRFYKNKDLDFKVRFQNNGEGPAHSIKLNVDIPKIYDKYSLKVDDLYPHCPICPDREVSYSCLDTLLLKDKIVFHFKNIYLPGSNQKNVNDRDSTKGFVLYTLHFNKKIPKQKSVSRTAIIFDKNDPIYTNYTSTRFNLGLSIGAKVGYNLFPKLQGSKNYFVGITLSPYKSQHGYFQAELTAGVHTYYDSANSQQTEQSVDTYTITNLKQRNDHSNIALYFVPASYRYSINKFVGVGGGVQLSINLAEKVQADAMRERTTYPLKPNGTTPETIRARMPTVENKNSFSNFNSALFGDLTLGSARIGPTAGVRYIYNFNKPNEQWQFYILWKF
jgi:hypothetical protein